MGEYYFLDSDDDGHWYVVKECYRQKWDEWRNLDENDERSWSPPPFAVMLGVHPNQIVFCSWEFVE